MSIQEEKLSLMSSLTKTWDRVFNLPENHDDRWVGMQPEVEGSTAAVERIADGVRRLDHREQGDTAASGDIQQAAVKLSGHLIVGTNIADSAMRQAGADQHDAEVAQSWTDALQFVDAFCLESQRRIDELKQDAPDVAGNEKNRMTSEENAYHLGVSAGSLDTAAQVARQQYERGIRMSLQGPLAEYAAASALESGLTQRPDSSPVYGIYRAIHEQTVIVESIPEGQLFAVPVNAAAAKALQADDSGLRGNSVVYAYLDQDTYTHYEPAEFADGCRIKAAGFRESAGYQDDGETYRKLLKESERLMTLANRINPPQKPQKDVSLQPPARSREEIVAGAVARMNQAFGYADTGQATQKEQESPSTSGVAFHLDGEGSVIWDSPRESVRLASAGYSILPVIHYGPGATPWICMEGERPTSLLVEHQGRAVVEFPVSAGAESAFGTSEADRAEALSQGMEYAMAYVKEAKAASIVSTASAVDTTADSRATDKLPDADARAQRLTHIFHMGLLERLDSPDVHGPEVDDVRNDGLSATVLALVKDANANTFAIIEADDLRTERQADTASAKPRPFAIPVADEDVGRLTVGESTSFLMLDWREHCTVLKQPDQSVDAAGHEVPLARQATEAGLGL